ncbi:MAG: hypothetical protein J6T99_06195 [Oscillospiraceae bacterium]|nr:hypothetical protein [Oscillospiraceae bacterium]
MAKISKGTLFMVGGLLLSLAAGALSGKASSLKMEETIANKIDTRFKQLEKGKDE